MMDKFLLQEQVLKRLAESLLQAEQAVQAADETATHEESIAENKYDTLGLEAAYLATGHADAGAGGRCAPTKAKPGLGTALFSQIQAQGYRGARKAVRTKAVLKR
ncbi:hypothetical protein [Agrobacterium sp.]|uniref:hypothetical protein n=1 Tax=Agrobacterium sp. TaxID=361 RepID=UPI0040333514